MSNYRRWLLLGGLGLALTGAGLCFAIEAAFVKHEGTGDEWVWLGTGALIVFNAGLGVVGEANFCRMKHWMEKQSPQKEGK